MFRPALALPLALLVPIAAVAAPRSFESVGEFARAIGLKPGGWRTSIKVTAIEIETPPGMDPAALAAFKAEMPFTVGMVQEQDECAAIALGGPTLPGILLDKGCVFTRMEAGDGRWAMASNCRPKGHGGLGMIAGEGTYSPRAVTGRQEIEHVVGDVIVRVKGEMTARFTGKCQASARPVPSRKKD